MATAAIGAPITATAATAAPTTNGAQREARVSLLCSGALTVASVVGIGIRSITATTRAIATARNGTAAANTLTV